MNHTHKPPSDQAWQASVARSGAPLDGVVSAIVPFGAFVRFDEGVDGWGFDSTFTHGPARLTP